MTFGADDLLVDACRDSGPILNPESSTAMEHRLNRTIEPAWSTIRTIREEVGQLLEKLPSEPRSATMMTASELLENAVKYGERVPGAPRIVFSLSALEDRIRIQVVNGSTELDCVQELKERIEEVTRAEDKTALYVRRLQELIANPNQNCKLGIYRIGVEGGFDLAYDYVDSMVTVVASRRIG